MVVGREEARRGLILKPDFSQGPAPYILRRSRVADPAHKREVMSVLASAGMGRAALGGRFSPPLSFAYRQLRSRCYRRMGRGMAFVRVFAIDCSWPMGICGLRSCPVIGVVMRGSFACLEGTRRRLAAQEGHQPSNEGACRSET